MGPMSRLLSVLITSSLLLPVVIAGPDSAVSLVRQRPGHHTLKITGDKDAKDAFLLLLSRCTGEGLTFGADGETVVDGGNLPNPAYNSLRTLKDSIIASGNTVIVKARDGPVKGLDVDAWSAPAGGTINGDVDMHDVNSLPADVEIDRNGNSMPDGLAVEGTWTDTTGGGGTPDGIPDEPAASPARPQHAMTRCNQVAHVLGERSFGVNNAAKKPPKGLNLYTWSHDIPAAGEGGSGAENAMMGERWVNDTTTNTVGMKAGSDAAGQYVDHKVGGSKHIDIVFSYTDGSTERWHFTGAKGQFTVSYEK